METNINSLRDRLDLILSRMSIHLPFIAAVAMSMHVRVEKCNTAKTNGKWVAFDPDYAGSLTDPELAYLYAHETLHKARMHNWRRGMRDPKLWNIACDHVNNLDLNAMRNSTLSMPKDGYADRRFSGMSEEEIYDKLLSEGFSPPGGFESDIVEDGELTQATVEIEVINIAKACKMAGIGSGMVDAILGNAGKSQVRWQDVLRSYVTNNIRSGSTWRRPNRRSEEFYLPSLRSKVLGSIVLFGDVSGSMWPLLQLITDEMQGVIDDVSPEFTHVICGDSRVSHVQTFERGSRLEFKTHGGGGTDFRPLFDEVEKRGWQPDCAVFLTDTYGSFPAAPPPYPVLWGVIGAENVSVPWGEIVMVKK